MNGREPKSCLGRVLNFKLGGFVGMLLLHVLHKRPHLELKIWSWLKFVLGKAI